MKKEKTEDTEHVKGLLGYSKGRVVFFLGMNVGSVSVYLNKEDGSQ
jgi:vacuolar protein sorting-associated protein 13A/C